MQEKKKKGVVYLSRVPTYMNASTVRRHFQAYGVERVYLSCEANAKRKQRSNKKRRYEEGWVEFEDKQDAKEVALLFNGHTVGGKKRHNPNRDDTWCIRYLPKFTWEHLRERTHTEERL